jgi:SAM-dependent methyltransferase
MSGMKNAARALISESMWSVVGMLCGAGRRPDIRVAGGEGGTAVDSFWSESHVQKKQFKAALQSSRDLKKRFEVCPLFSELMGFYGSHEGETILDYGCGTGNDLVGFAMYSRAEKIIGMDVSAYALEQAAHRLSLHRIPPQRIELIKTSDAVGGIPLESDSVDYISCVGVLQHVSEPTRVLRELHRVLRPGAIAAVMVYNYFSLWYHLYVAYEKQIVNNEFKGMSVDEAFSKTTDGENCPVVRIYKPDEFVAICASSGFTAEFRGGHFSYIELDSFRLHGPAALGSDKLGIESRNFLKNLTKDERGYPQFNGKYCGVGGVYFLRK